MNQKLKWVIIILSILLFVFFIPPTIYYFEGKLVNLFYPLKACGYGGSALGSIQKKCDCSGISVSDHLIGSHKTVCFGECTNCNCWKYDELDYNESNIILCEPDYILKNISTPSADKPIVGINSRGITLSATNQMNITIKYYNNKKQIQLGATVIIDKCKSSSTAETFSHGIHGNYPVSVITQPIDVEPNSEVEFPIVLENINLVIGDKYICKLEIVQNSNTTHIYESLVFFLTVIK